MARMHYSEATGGPMPCKAAPGRCPLTEVNADGEQEPAFHSEDPKEMEAHIAKKMGGVFKKSATKLEKQAQQEETYEHPVAIKSLKLGQVTNEGEVTGIALNKSGTAGKLFLKNADGSVTSRAFGGNAKTPADHTLMVTDQRPTREANMAKAELRIRENFAASQDSTSHAIAELQEKLAANYLWQSQDSFTMNQVVAEGAALELQRNMQGLAASLERRGEEYPFAKAAQKMRASSVEAALNFARRGASHSTSDMSNTIDMIKMGVQADALKSLGVKWDVVRFEGLETPGVTSTDLW